MRFDLSIQEIIHLANVISNLPGTPDIHNHLEKSPQLSELLGTEVKYSKNNRLFTAQVNIRDGVGELIETHTFYNCGLLKAMANYHSAMDYELMHIMSYPFLDYENSWERLYTLSQMLGYDTSNNGGPFDIVKVAKVNGELEFRLDNKQYSLEEFLIEVVNV